MAIVVLVALGVCSAAARPARAETTVEVIATDPAGSSVALDRNQNFYLRLRYSTDRPASIWVQPYFQGREVGARTSPSGRYSGRGEALAWFFLMQPGDQVDEIRIKAGNGSRDGTHEVATYPVRIIGGSRSAVAGTPPAWLVDLKRQNEAAAREAYESAARTPPSSGDMLFFGGFMLAMLCIGLLGLAAPAWGVWRWGGGWRVAAAAPASLMAFVALRIVVDGTRDPTSHNLWPFEILQAGALSVVVMTALWMARRLAGAGPESR
ncbi:MAG: hypothetical protein WEF50_04695 [Myxococcota bacterium]